MSRIIRILEETGAPRHSFAVCAYGDSPYLDACLRSLKEQTIPSEVIVCTSTPSDFITAAAEKYGFPVLVRDGASGIGADWNFAFDSAKGTFVTLAHQDDVYGRHYTEELLKASGDHPDMVLFTTKSVTLKNGRPERPGTVEMVKELLRLPLRFPFLTRFTEGKRLALRMGNPVICPSCGYRKDICGPHPFSETRKFILDWEFLFDLAAKGGTWILREKPLILYRVHGDAATAACIGDHVREQEEAEMFRRLWPRPVSDLILHYYRRSYEAYKE